MKASIHGDISAVIKVSTTALVRSERHREEAVSQSVTHDTSNKWAEGQWSLQAPAGFSLFVVVVRDP